MEGVAKRSAREHFGKGKLKVEPAKSIFINCPYDKDFEPLFDALVFATVSCGFMPRSALESGSVADPRMERITRAIFSSKYSIHDLSRCRSEGDEQLARFNMPLELGIAMARRYTEVDNNDEKHDWLLLVPEGHYYLKFISDLAGFDPPRHDGRAETVVRRVMPWLATRPDALRTPNSKEVLAALPAFQAERIKLKESWGEDVPWADVVLAAIDTVPKL